MTHKLMLYCTHHRCLPPCQRQNPECVWSGFLYCTDEGADCWQDGKCTLVDAIAQRGPIEESFNGEIEREMDNNVVKIVNTDGRWSWSVAHDDS